MYIGYIHDRKKLGFSCIEDVLAAKQISDFKNFLKKNRGISVAYIVKKGKQISILIFSKEVLVAVLIFVESIYGNINPNLYDPSFSWAEVSQSSVSKPNNFGFLTASSQIPDFILKLKGGSDELTNEEQERLVKSILAKVSESNYQETSPNKFLKRVLELMDPVISNQRFWRVLSELEKPHKFNMIQPTNQSTSSNRPKGFEKVTDEFESRLTKQKVLNEHDSKLSGLHAEHRKKVNRFNRMLQFLNPRPSRAVNLSKSGLPHKKTTSVIKQEKIGSNVNSLGRSEWRSTIFGMREKIIVSAAPSSSESNITPTGSWDYKEVMRELDSQSSKKRIDVQGGDQIYILKNPYHEGPYELGDKLADQIYESIRESDTDICDIAENLGFKADNIKNLKDHVFYNKHDLDRYGPDQIERKQFDPNLQQALAWKRLETGTHTQDDVTWIKHECAERHHELKYGSGYNEAHNRAQTRFDGAPWENQF